MLLMSFNPLVRCGVALDYFSSLTVCSYSTIRRLHIHWDAKGLALDVRHLTPSLTLIVYRRCLGYGTDASAPAAVALAIPSNRFVLPHSIKYLY